MVAAAGVADCMERTLDQPGGDKPPRSRSRCPKERQRRPTAGRWAALGGTRPCRATPTARSAEGVRRSDPPREAILRVVGDLEEGLLPCGREKQRWALNGNVGDIRRAADHLHLDPHRR